MLEAVTGLVEKFLITKLIVAVVIAVISTVALWAIGIDYSYLLGAIVGLTTLLPTIGFLISLVPFVLVSFATGSGLAQTGLALGVLTAIHLVEANVLTPRLVGRKLNLNTLTTIVGLFAGGLLWGVWGMFLSVPILGVMRIVFSVSPQLAPWGELMADREDRDMAARLVSRRLRAVLAKSRRPLPLQPEPPAPRDTVMPGDPAPQPAV